VTLTQGKGSYQNPTSASVDVAIADGTPETCTVEATPDELKADDVSNVCRYDAPAGASIAVSTDTSSNQATCAGDPAELPCTFDLPAEAATVEVIFPAGPD
jgi:hypothetical protein